MRCDLHVHPKHSGQCTIPLLRPILRGMLHRPGRALRDTEAQGMDLVTVTDRDSITAAEHLRRYPDFFTSVEVRHTPAGTELYASVCDVSERQFVEIDRRRRGFASFFGYVREQGFLCDGEPRLLGNYGTSRRRRLVVRRAVPSIGGAKRSRPPSFSSQQARAMGIEPRARDDRRARATNGSSWTASRCGAR